MRKHLLQPDLQVEHLLEIPIAQLKAKNICGIIFDLDNTIIAWDHQEMQQEIITWLSTLKRQGFKIYIVSNSVKKRVAAIADQLELPYTAQAGKPMNHGFKKALAILSLEASQIAVVGDQLFTDVFGGNRIGAFTILVKPLGEREFFLTKFTRVFERLFLKAR